MKKLSTYLFLFLFSFQTSSWADDITDFQIEGMSIEDSALDYFSEIEIKKNINKQRYKSNKFYVVDFTDSTKFKDYDALQFHFKRNDSKYIIYSISGNSIMEIKSCLDKQKEIYEEISELFTDVKEQDNGKRNHPAYEKSYTYDMYFQFKSKDLISVSCYDFSEKLSFEDKLLIAIDTKEFNDFLDNEAHK